MSKAEKGKHSVILKLNGVASSPLIYKKIFAFGNVEQLWSNDNRFCIVYPEIDEDEHFLNMDLPTNVDPETFLLVQAKNVLKNEVKDSTSTFKCSKEKEWQQMNDEISDEIRSAFKPPRWKIVFSVFKEILKSPDLCISSDFKEVLIKANKKLSVSVIDLLSVLTRRSAPAEDITKLGKFVPFVRILIQNKIPSTYLKNHKLVELSQGKSKKLKGKSNASTFTKAQREWFL